jgi:hypothetical protein
MQGDKDIPLYTNFQTVTGLSITLATMAQTVRDVEAAWSSVRRSNTASTSATTQSNTWHNAPLFNKQEELCFDLEYIYREDAKSRYLRNLGGYQTLPDQPRIKLDSSELISYCLQDLDTPWLNKLKDRLWNTSPSPRISSLAEQFTRGRRLQITEDPCMHLIWTDNIIFIKPLPAFLCSHAFWEFLLDKSNDSITEEDRDKLIRTSLGFLRSYAALIYHKSDFIAAKQSNILPDDPDITFDAFSNFIVHFANLPSPAISIRWRYGELPLDGLNSWSIITRRRFHMDRYKYRYSAYFERRYPAVLFLFAIFSVILSAMQVIVGGRQLWDTDNSGLRKTLQLFEWFGCEAVGWSIGLGLMFLLCWLALLIAERVDNRKKSRKWKKKWAEENGEKVPRCC